MNINFTKGLLYLQDIDEMYSIDEIYNLVDRLIDKGDFKSVDKFIIDVINIGLNITLIVSVLTITHPKREFLNNRTTLITHLINFCKSTGLTDKQVDNLVYEF